MNAVKSKLGTIDWFDIGKTFIIGLGSAVITAIINLIQSGQVSWGSLNWNAIATTAGSAAGIYILKQLGTNSNNQLLTPEPPSANDNVKG
jgi:hypothetical protein